MTQRRLRRATAQRVRIGDVAGHDERVRVGIRSEVPAFLTGSVLGGYAELSIPELEEVEPRLLSPPVILGTSSTAFTGTQGPTRWRDDGYPPRREGLSGGRCVVLVGRSLDGRRPLLGLRSSQAATALRRRPGQARYARRLRRPWTAPAGRGGEP
jgi:hypothetical protein